jgi:tetratricopeptide (TPR) repeat protein
MASGLKDLGRLDEALIANDKALAIRIKLLSLNHPDTINSRACKGLILQDQGKFEEALVVFDEVLQSRRLFLGEDHAETVACLTYKANILRALGRFDEALVSYEQIIVLLKRVLDENHPDLASGIGNKALCLQEMGRPQEALPMYDQVLSIDMKVFGPHHPSVANDLNNKADCLRSLGRFNEALVLYDQALAIRIKVYGQNHSTFATTLHNKAGCLRSLGRNSEANQLEKQAFEIAERVLGLSHPATMKYMESAVTSAYLEAIREGDTAPFGRSKLGMVGRGRAGKSSTVSSLLGLPFDPHKASTVGADTSYNVTVDKVNRVVNWKQKHDDTEMQVMLNRVAAYKFTNNKRRGDFQSNRSDIYPTTTSAPLLEIVTDDIKSDLRSVERLPEPNVAKLFNQELFNTALAEENDPSRRPVTLSIWDFGGQRVFHSLLHLFLTNSGVYCIVFDMRDLLPTQTEILRQDAIEDLLFWINSLSLFAPGTPMCLVGTFKDEVFTPSAWLLVDELLVRETHLSSNTQIIPNIQDKLWFFPVDNTKSASDPVIVRLREILLDSVKDSPDVTRLVPVTWTRAYDMIAKERGSMKYIDKQHVAEICKSCGVLLDHISGMLLMFHELGMWLYFDSSPELRQLVIIDPQWIVDAATKFVRDKRFHHHDLKTDSELRTKYGESCTRLLNHGILEESLLNFLWNKESSDSIREFLLLLMLDMNLICKWYGGDDGTTTNKYLVPSILDMDPSLRTLPEEDDPPIHPTASFEFDFSKTFLPSGLFSRFLALTAAHASTMENSRAPGVSRGSARLSFGLDAEFSLDVVKDVKIRVGVCGKVPLVINSLSSIMGRISDETAPRLKYSIVLIVPGNTSSNTEMRIPLEQVVEEHKKDKPSAQIRSKIGQHVISLANAEIFFDNNNNKKSVELAQQQLSAKKHANTIDVYLAHVQSTGGDQCKILRLELEKYGVTSWLDQHATEITEDEMVKGINKARKILVFLSKGVFQSRWVQFEVRTAIKLQKPILFVHETNYKCADFAEIYDIKANTPMDLQYLFKDIESIGFERRSYLVDGMMKELIRRING